MNIEESNSQSEITDPIGFNLVNANIYVFFIFFIPGMYTLRVDCTPSLHTLVYDLTKQVSMDYQVYVHLRGP